MILTPLAALYAVWAVWALSWLAAALWITRTVARSALPGTQLSRLVAALGYACLLGERPHRAAALWQAPAALGWSMVALAIAGILFAWWARIHLGRLWSGGVVRREGHRLVDTGPYAIVRHPIYTGLIAGTAAVAVVKASPLAVVGTLLVAAGFTFKARVEERFLAAELGEQAYAAYRARVPMLLPRPRP